MVYVGLRKKQLDVLMRDVTALGGGFFTLFLAILLHIVGKDVVAQRLIMGFFMVYPIVGVIRALYFKERPRKESYKSLLEKLDASSFPSIHSANAFYAAYVLHHTFSSNPASLFLFLMAGFIAYSRIYMKKHYLSDTVTGAALGMLLAYLTVTYLIP